LLGAKLLNGEKEFAEAWNFSPFSSESRTVEEITAIAKHCWNDIDIEFGKPLDNFHEAGLLMLDNAKAISKLHWKPVWDTTEAVEKTIEWYKGFYNNNELLTSQNINDYLNNI
jgi:CDP-glucose 4,6-dehydratase